MIPQEALDRNLALMNVIQPLGSILDKMTDVGTAPISEEVLRFKARAWTNRIKEVRDTIYSDPRIGTRFNLNSNPQCKSVLYGKLRFPEVKRYDAANRKETVTVNQYAINLLYYNTKDPLLRSWGLLQRLRHRKSNFVDKLLLYKPCPKCTDKSRWACDYCAGSGYGEILGPNPRYVSIRDGWWWLHPVYLQLAVTGRLNCLDPNLLQWPRNSVTWNIDCRDIFVAPPGKSFVLTDRSKAERLVGAVIFNDPIMLAEVMSGSKAFSGLAQDCFGLTEAECRKGTDWYTAMKTSAYSDQYFVQAQTLHEYLMKQDIHLPLDECKRVLIFLADRYAAYKANAEQFVWEKLHMPRPFTRNLHGRLFRFEMPIELSEMEFRTVKYTRNAKARAAFAEMCRKIVSFVIQGSATGDDCQLTALKIVDELDQMTRPGFFSLYRYLNGDWTKAAPFIFKHDEWGILCDDDLIPEVKALLKKHAEDFNHLEPYLTTTFDKTFNMGSETEVQKQWSVEPEEGWEQMLEMKNAEHFYRNGIRFKA